MDSKKRIRSQSDDGSESQTSQRARRDWQQILDDGLAHHRQCKAMKEASNQAANEPPVRYVQLLKSDKDDAHTGDQTLLAIATFWEALRQHDMLFAFAGMDFYDQADQDLPPDFGLTPIGVVGAPHDFIMPLMLQSNSGNGNSEEEHNDIGHLVLAVAHWHPDRGKVQIEIYNSLPEARDSHVTQRSINIKARQLVAGSPHWPEEKQGGKAHPFATNFQMNCPLQEGLNNCGLYQILNAWCIMLDIPIFEGRNRRVHASQSQEFLDLALEIVNLALMGCLESQTFQAFVNVWGYSDEQDVHKHPTENVTAVRMSEDILRRCLLKQAAAEGRGVAREEDILMVWEAVGGDSTMEEARDLLAEEEGDLKLVLNRIVSSTVTSISTSPEPAPAATTSTSLPLPANDTLLLPEPTSSALRPAVTALLQAPSAEAIVLPEPIPSSDSVPAAATSLPVLPPHTMKSLVVSPSFQDEEEELSAEKSGVLRLDCA